MKICYMTNSIDSLKVVSEGLSGVKSKFISVVNQIVCGSISSFLGSLLLRRNNDRRNERDRANRFHLRTKTISSSLFGTDRTV